MPPGDYRRNASMCSAKAGLQRTRSQSAAWIIRTPWRRPVRSFRFDKRMAQIIETIAAPSWGDNGDRLTFIKVHLCTSWEYFGPLVPAMHKVSAGLASFPAS